MTKTRALRCRECGADRTDAFRDGSCAACGADWPVFEL